MIKFLQLYETNNFYYNNYDIEKYIKISFDSNKKISLNEFSFKKHNRIEIEIYDMELNEDIFYLIKKYNLRNIAFLKIKKRKFNKEAFYV